MPNDDPEPTPANSCDSVTPEELQAYAMSRLALPAFGLLSVSLLATAFSVLGLTLQAIVFFSERAGVPIGSIPLIPQATWPSLAFQLGGLALNAATVVGAMSMRSRRYYSVAMTGAMMALIPYGCACTIPTCLPLWVGSFAFGFWALTALSDGYVRSAFKRPRTPLGSQTIDGAKP
jgi:hypothetical protein